MALVVADRVQQTTTTAGTGTVTLSGSVAGYQSFSAIGNGNTTYYTLVDGSNWEVGIGTYTASGTTLSRDTVYASSAGGTTKITLSGNTTYAFVTYPAEIATMLGNTSTGSGSVVLATSPSLTTPTLGVATGTSLALGGSTIGTNALAVTGTSAFSSTVTHSGATTLSGALTYGGVTLSNAVTGTGNMVLSTSPTLTTPAIGAATGTSLALGGATIGTNALAVTGTSTFSSTVTNSGATTLSGALTYGGVTLSNAVTGTGNMVLSASPTLTGTMTAAAGNFSGALQASSFTSSHGTASVPVLTWTTVATIPGGVSTFLCTAQFNFAVASYSASMLVHTDSGSYASTTLTVGSNISVQASGSNFQVYLPNVGGTQTVKWTITTIAG